MKSLARPSSWDHYLLGSCAILEQTRPSECWLAGIRSHRNFQKDLANVHSGQCGIKLFQELWSAMWLADSILIPPSWSSKARSLLRSSHAGDLLTKRFYIYIYIYTHTHSVANHPYLSVFLRKRAALSAVWKFVNSPRKWEERETEKKSGSTKIEGPYLHALTSYQSHAAHACHGSCTVSTCNVTSLPDLNWKHPHCQLSSHATSTRIPYAVRKLHSWRHFIHVQRSTQKTRLKHSRLSDQDKLFSELTPFGPVDSTGKWHSPGSIPTRV